MSKLGLWLQLAMQSAWSRRVSMGLVAASIALATTLVLAIHQVGADARSSFSRAVSGVDLIVGAKASPIELLLNTVFQIGRGTAVLPEQTGERLRAIDGVDWVVPVAMGDFVGRQPVVATTPAYFEHVRAAGQAITLARGDWFKAPTDVVLGARAAHKLGLSVGSAVVFSHGTFGGLAKRHDHISFEVSGVLAPTGAPIDQAVWVSLAGFQAAHTGGAANSFEGLMQQATQAQGMQVNAWLLGLTSPAKVFSVRRTVQGIDSPALSAVMPGVALDELWQTLGIVEATLRAVAWLVAVGAGLALAATLLMSLQTRKREIAVLRATGASSGGLMVMVLAEALLTFVLGATTGMALLHVCIALGSEWLRTATGVVLSHSWVSTQTVFVLLGLLVIAVASALLPAWLSTRSSLGEALNPRSIG